MMNLGTLIVLAILVIVVALALRAVVKRKGTCSCGCGGSCTGNCSTCGSAGGCDIKKK